MFRIQFREVFYFIFLILFLNSCGSKDRFTYYEFYISNSKKAIFKVSKDLKVYIKVDKKELFLKKLEGSSSMSDTPITILQYNNVIYSIILYTGFGNSDEFNITYLMEKEGEFIEISRLEFPKELVIRNIFAPGQGQSKDKNGRLISDYIDIEKKKDINDPLFCSSRTGKVWQHIVSERKLAEIFLWTSKEDVKKFKEQYALIEVPLEELKEVTKEEADKY